MSHCPKASCSQQPSGRNVSLLSSLWPSQPALRKGSRDNQSYLCVKGCHCPQGHSDLKQKGTQHGGQEVGLQIIGARGKSGLCHLLLVMFIHSFIHSFSQSVRPSVRHSMSQTTCMELLPCESLGFKESRKRHGT